MTRLWLPAVTAGLAVILLVTNPHRLFSFKLFAFHDQGATLTLDRLVTEGDRPYEDIRFLYGLGAVAFGRGVFATFGRTPETFAAVSGTLAVAYAAILGMCGAASARGLLGRALAVAVIPVALAGMPFLSFAHGLESVLITATIHSVIRNRLPFALSLATAAVFVKPAMGYPFGLVILVLIVRDAVRASVPTTRLVIRGVLPAAVTAGVIGGLLAVAFGPRIVLESLLPTAGMEVYRREGMGLFHGNGWRFLWMPGLRPGYYIGTPAGFWLVATAVLWAACGRLVVFRLTAPVGTNRVTVVCGVLHAIFVFTAFGGPGSWINYFAFLAVGVVGSVSVYRTGPATLAVCGMAVLATGVLLTTLRAAVTTGQRSV